MFIVQTVLILSVIPGLPSSHFFFNDTATTEIYTLSLHDALPISRRCPWSRLLPIGHDDEGSEESREKDVLEARRIPDCRVFGNLLHHPAALQSLGLPGSMFVLGRKSPRETPCVNAN